MHPSDKMTIAGHLDLKGLPPKPARLLELLALMKAGGYDALLVEWEDTFPWTFDPELRAPDAYTPAFLAQFHETARRLALEVIPLIPTLGHMEFVLNRPRYAALREDPARTDVLNPLAPGSGELVGALIEDVLRYDPHPRFLHLGGDEAYTFGTHAQTRDYIAKHGRPALFLRHFWAHFRTLSAKGVRPLIWHDMPCDWPDADIRHIAEAADIVAWAYAGGPDHARPHHGFTAAQRLGRLGVPCWGATAYKGADGADGDLPMPERRLENMRGWRSLTPSCNFRGMLATGWSRYSYGRLQCDPIEGALDLLLMAPSILRGSSNEEARLHAERILREAGEYERWEERRAALARLQTARQTAWNTVRYLDHQAVTVRLDWRRRHSGIETEYLRALDQQIADVERHARSAARMQADAVQGSSLRSYVAERVEPLARRRAAHLDLMASVEPYHPP